MDFALTNLGKIGYFYHGEWIILSLVGKVIVPKGFRLHDPQHSHKKPPCLKSVLGKQRQKISWDSLISQFSLACEL